MPSEEERYKRLEMISQQQDFVFKTDPQDTARLKEAEDFLNVLRARAAELTEEEKNRLDAECDEALDRELKKGILRKAHEILEAREIEEKRSQTAI